MLKHLFSKVKSLFQKTPSSNESGQKPETELAINQKIFNALYTKYKKKFEEKIFTQIVLLPEDEICAQIAGESYITTKERRKNIDGYTLDEKISTPAYAIYSNTDSDGNKICIIGYRGTVITELKDIASDAQIILDIQGIDPRIKDALHIYDTVRREYQGYQLRVCGHSLGGTLSYIVSKHRNPGRCVVFNPGVSLNTFFIQMLQDSVQNAEWAEHTYTYKILGDIISAIAYIGHVKTFTIKGSDPLALHAINNFLNKKKTGPEPDSVLMLPA